MHFKKRLLISAMFIAAAISITSNATPQSTYECGSPACNSMTSDPYAARLDAAWKAEVTTPEQREKMAAIVTEFTSDGGTDWKKTAEAYFSWRNGKPYVYVASESYHARQAHDYSILRAQVESHILKQLVDPDSARFEWPYEFINGSWKPDAFQKRMTGLITCGYVNSKNRMGGYTGRMAFSVVMDDGVISHLSIDSPGSELNALLCGKARLPSL